MFKRLSQITYLISELPNILKNKALKTQILFDIIQVIIDWSDLKFERSSLFYLPKKQE